MEKTAGTKGLEIPKAVIGWGFKGDNYLFTIGIDKYTRWPPLNCAVKDIKDFTNILLERYQFDKKYVTSLTDKKATEQNILATMRELSGKISEEDNLVIYFSGHGHFDETTKSGFWIPVNAGPDIENEHEFLNTAIIVDKLRAINTLHTFLIIDACFSGTLLVQLKSAPRDERYKSRKVLTSGRSEVVSDGVKGMNSPFAKAIINSLTLNTDQHLRASQLIVDVKEYVSKEAQQTPMDAVLLNSDDQGGDFIFHLKVSEDEIWTSILKENSIEGYSKFVTQYPKSEHFEEAKESLEWLKAKKADSVQAIQEYIDNYRGKDGVYVGLAITRQRELESKTLWEKANAQNTISAYNHFIFTFPESEHVQEAEERIKKKGSQPEITSRTVDIPIETDDELQWGKVKNGNAYKTYLNFTRAFPDSVFKREAVEIMTRLDNIALNRLKILETHEEIGINKKIEACNQYFKDFQGSQNLNLVKQLKNRLEIQKIKRGF